MNETPVISEDDNVISLDEWKATPKTASKEPPKSDWLSGLKTGTEFLCRNLRGLTPDWLVVEWIMGGWHSTGNVLLIPAKDPNNTKAWQWVDPITFCRAHEFRGIIEDMPTEEDNDVASDS